MTPSPLRLFFDARTIRPGMTGVGRYSMELLRSLAEWAREQSARLRIRAMALDEVADALRSQTIFDAVEWVPVPWDYESHPGGDWGLRFSIPRLVKPGEIYHGPAFTVPGGNQAFPRVVTIHDFGVFRRPRDYPWKFAAFMRWQIRRSIRTADRIIVPTRAVADDMSRFFPNRARRAVVVHEAASSSHIAGWDAGEPAESMDPAGRAPYFLSIGTLEPRKGAATALAALEAISVELGVNCPDWIWVGAVGFKGNEFARRVSESPARHRWKVYGYQSIARIEELLSGALALVYPSLDEGFGLPPLQAMGAGVPAIVSDIPALREVCGEAALYFPAGDAVALAALLRRLTRDPGLMDDLRLKGKTRATEFSWRRAAGETFEVYASLRADSVQGDSSGHSSGSNR